MNLLEQLKKLALRNHYECEDPWYSCPKSEEGCADDERGDECTCGADSHNAEVEAVYAEILRHYGEKLFEWSDTVMTLKRND